MTVVALTGGIAAGKSLVCDVLSQHGVRVVDADQVARDVVQPGMPALEAIAKRFGPDVLQPDGSLDRQALGQLVFADQAAREDLNAIVHPAVWQESHRLFSEHGAEYPAVPLVYAVPLLVEGNRVDEFDLVIVVHAPRETRVARLVDHRGMSHDDAVARVDAQATDEERLSIADVVLHSGDTEDQTRSDAIRLATLLVEHWPDGLEALPAAFSSPTR